MLTEQEELQLTFEERRVYHNADPDQQRMFAQVWRENRNNAINSPNSNSVPSSIMRVTGAWGTIISGIALLIVTFLYVSEPYRGGLWLLWMVFFGGIFSLTIVMWMLGAIEARLIEINATLKRRR